MAETSELEWAAFAAIDWADQKHFWILVPTGSRQQETGEHQADGTAYDVRRAVALRGAIPGKPATSRRRCSTKSSIIFDRGADLLCTRSDLSSTRGRSGRATSPDSGKEANRNGSTNAIPAP